MVATPTTLVGYAALAASCFVSLGSAAPLLTNPTTPLGIVAPLTPQHPAFGAKRQGGVAAVLKYDPNLAVAESLEIVATPTNSTVGAPQRHLRNMEYADSDLERLESYYGEAMERNFKTLATKYGSGATASTPWPGSYWPTYQDGINAVWKAGEPSPAEKYARAFGLDAKKFMNDVSARSGIDGHGGNRACSRTSDCNSLNDGSECAKRAGQSKGVCIPTWWGLCHAWAPAAELEPEPRCATKKNGVTFRPMDIKALLTQMYNDAYVEVAFLGARFDGPDYPEDLDKYGRFKNAERRDMGPGLFHIAVTNVLGKNKQPFILDVTAGSAVWNQPVSKYQIIESRLVDPARASRYYFGTSTYPFNKDMKKLAYTRMTVSWVLESGEDGGLVSSGRAGSYIKTKEYEYFLELDADEKIIGGEWLNDANKDHPDFFWFPKTRIDPSTVTELGMAYKDLRAILDASVACQPEVPAPTPAPTTKTPTPAPTTKTPTPEPTTKTPTPEPTTKTPTPEPTTKTPTPEPTTKTPTPEPTTKTPTPEPTTKTPTPEPTTKTPTPEPTTKTPTKAPTPGPVDQSPKPTTPAPVGQSPKPTTPAPVGQSPKPTTAAPTPVPTTPAPVGQSPKPTTPAPVGQQPKPTPAVTSANQASTPAPSKPSKHKICV